MSKFAESFTLLLQVCVLWLVTEGLKPPKKIPIDNSTCILKEYEVHRYRRLIWDGRALVKNCRIGFKLSDTSELKFKVIFTEFVIKDCTFLLSFFYDSSPFAKKTLNCSSSPFAYEIENVQHLYLQFDTFNTSRSTVQFQVHAKYLNYTIGSAVISLVILAIVGVILCLVKGRNANIGNLFRTLCNCCCGLIEELLQCCHDQAGTCYSLLCPGCEDSSNNSVTTQQPTSQSELQSETEARTTDHSRRSSISSTTDVTSAGALMLVEGEPTAPPPYVFHYEHPSNERYSRPPPPSYDECVMD